MQFVRCLLVAATTIAASAAAASPLEKAAKQDLVTLYLLSIAADRCGFPMSAKQANSLERATKALVERLKLRPRENDALYSEADVKFERQGPKACDRDGKFAKGFGQTLQQLTGR